MYYTEPITFTPLEGPVQLRADVYPANVGFSFATAPYSKMRAIVTADSVYVLVDGQGSPRLVYEGRLEDVTGDRKTMVATTADGQITISRAQGCGCGSRLKSFKAYRNAARMATV